MRRSPRRRGGIQSVVVLTLASLTGCLGTDPWTEDLAWSPDGTRATLIRDSLHLLDPEGRLTPELVTDVYRAVWLDGSRVLLAQSSEVCSFDEVADAIGPERTKAVVERAERLLADARASKGETESEEPAGEELGAVFLYLREHHRETVHALCAGECEDLDEFTVTLHAVILARVSGDLVTMERRLHTALAPIRDIRPSPDRRRLLVTTERGLFSSSSYRLLALSLDHPGVVVPIEERTARFPEWTSDSGSAVYWQSLEPIQNDVIGCLTRAVIRFPLTKVGAEPPRCLVTAFIGPDARVRAAAGGRILFDAADVGLPLAGALPGVLEKTLFTYDPDASVAVSRALPAGHAAAVLNGFDVSPDGTRVLLSWQRGGIEIFSLETGRVETVDAGTPVKDDPAAQAPRAIWSGPDAFTYSRGTGADITLIRRQGTSETVLLKGW